MSLELEQKQYISEDFSVRHSRWERILVAATAPVDVIDRVRLLLPHSPVITPEHVDFYNPGEQYDCTDFAIFCTAPEAASLTAVDIGGETISRPTIKEGFFFSGWEPKDLAQVGFKKVRQVNPHLATLVILSKRHFIYDLSVPVHFGVHLGNIDGQTYIAHKPNGELLPDITTIQDLKKSYRREMSGLLVGVSVQFWGRDNNL
jgi:hypothetical protein